MLKPKKKIKRSMMITRLQAKRRRIERDEKVRIQFNSAMDKVNEMVKSYKQDVDNKLGLLQARTDARLLQMKWSDFMALAKTATFK